MWTTEIKFVPSQAVINLYNQRIDRGIQFLIQERGSRWDKGIDLNTLQLNHCCQCVCGQAFKDLVTSGKFTSCFDGFDVAVKKLGDSYNAARDHGFYLDWLDYPPTASIAAYSVLGDLWRARIIEKRRKEKRNLMKG